MEDHFQTLNDLALFSAYRVVIPQFQLYSQLKKKKKKKKKKNLETQHPIMTDSSRAV